MSLSYSPGVTRTPVPTVSLIARPDQARFHLIVRVEADSASASVPLLRRAAQRLEDLLPPLGATLHVHDFDMSSGSGKVVSEGTQLSATLVLPFGKELSFWDRAAKVAQVDDLLRALAQEGKRQKPSLEVRRDTPAYVVANPEAFRAELLTRLRARAQELGPEVELSEIHLERSVVQRAVSLEEVELSLQLDVVARIPA